MIKLQDIMEEIGRTLKSIYPNIKGVTSERIEDMDSIAPGFSIELISTRNEAVSQNIINTFVDMDIIYFSQNNTVLEAIQVKEKLARVFGLGLKVKDRYIHTLGDVESKLVDQDLHFLIRFDYADEYKPLYVDEDGNLNHMDTGSTDINNTDNKIEDTDENKILKENIEYMENLESLWTLK